MSFEIHLPVKIDSKNAALIAVLFICSGKRQTTNMQTTAEYFCASCGEPNLTFVDLSAGSQQSYVEDCQVCCRPNILYIRVDEETLEVEIDTEFEE